MEFLSSLAEASGFVVEAFWQRGLRQLPRAEVDAIERSVERRKKRWLLAQLKRRKLIEEQERGMRLSYALTKKARIELLIFSLRKKKAPLPRGQFCMVTYDIPESHRTTRALFRRLLKASGFIRIHGSVWVSQTDVGRELAMFLRAHGVQHSVHIICGKVIR